MNSFTEKIKNIFNGQEKNSGTEYKQDTEFSEARWSVSDIAKAIRESGKFQTQKKMWWSIFHF